MLKLAHSLSVAFGFMVACVNGVCGAEKSSNASYAFSDSPSGAKLCAASAKAPAQKIRAALSAGKASVQTCCAFLPEFFAEEIFSFDIAPACVRPPFFEAAAQATQVFFNPAVEWCSNPIRAPAAA